MNTESKIMGRRLFTAGGLAFLASALGCHNKSDSSQVPAAPKFGSKFTPRYATVNSTLVANGASVPMTSGARHDLDFTFDMSQDFANLQVGYRVNKEGEIETEFYSQPMSKTAGRKTVGLFSVPVLNEMDSGNKAYTIDCIARNADTGETADVMTFNPAVAWGGNDTVSTYRVDEAMAYLNGKTNLVGIVGDNAPSEDVLTLADIANKFPHDGKIASEVPVLIGSGFNGGFLVGMPADNARVQEILSAVPVTDAGYLTVRDTKDGGLYVVVSGTATDKTRMAGRVVKDNELYSMPYNGIKVTGDLDTPVVEAA